MLGAMLPAVNHASAWNSLLCICVVLVCTQSGMVSSADDGSVITVHDNGSLIISSPAKSVVIDGIGVTAAMSSVAQAYTATSAATAALESTIASLSTATASMLDAQASVSSSTIAGLQSTLNEANPASAFILGGGGYFDFNSVEVYHSRYHAWSVLPRTMSATRKHAGADIVGRRVYIFGGLGVLASGEYYDLDAHSWTSITDMQVAKYLHVAVATNSNTIMIVAGSIGPAPTDSTEIYTLSNDTWSTGPSVAEVRQSHAAVMWQGKLILISGSTMTGPSVTCEQHDAMNSTGPWTSFPQLHVPRDGVAAVVVAGKIYALGGQDSGGPQNTAEVFDSSVGGWVVLNATMSVARLSFAAAEMRGKVIIAGGWGGSYALSSVEMYDPVSNTWTTLADLSAARYGACGVPVP